MDDTELRKWSVEQASQAGAGANMLEVARELYLFVKAEDIKHSSLSLAQSLTPKQIEVLRAMIELKELGKKVNGSSIAERLEITQSYASTILRKLIELDYVERKGNDFWLANDGMGAVVNLFED